MLRRRRFRLALLGSLLYLGTCVLGGIFVADATLHPARRLLSDADETAARVSMSDVASGFDDVSVTTEDRVVLRGWLLRPRIGNGGLVLVLHGLADNRVGMLGYARLFLSHGFGVVLPDARAHGASGGTIATYGLLEKNDIRAWFEFLESREPPRCIFGFGESMGAAQLLQSLSAGVNFCALAVESPFANFREIAYDRVGQALHLGPWIGRTLLRPLVEVAFWRTQWKYGANMREISPEYSARAVRVPILLVHGVVDSNIPVRHSRRIHDHAPGTALWEVPGADHCGAISVAPQEFEKRVVDWFVAHDARIEISSTAPKMLN